MRQRTLGRAGPPVTPLELRQIEDPLPEPVGDRDDARSMGMVGR